MENTNSSAFNFSSVGLLQLILKNIKILFIVTLSAAIITAIATFFIRDKYKSTVILFPTTTTSISKTLLSKNSIKEGIMQFGEEEESERILQVLNSDIIRNKVINRFGLLNHYRIDSGVKYPKTKLINKFKNNFTFRRTKYMAIEINVMDEDPQMAADMANYTALLIDTIMNAMYKERAMQAFRIVEEEYFSMEAQIKAIRDSIQRISEYGVNDYESQSEVFNSEYAKVLASGNMQAVKRLEEKMKVLEKYGGSFLAFKNLLEFESERFSQMKERYAEAKVDAYQFIPYKYILDNAYKAEKKSYPKRFIIVAVSAFSTFLLALFLIVIKESKIL